MIYLMSSIFVNPARHSFSHQVDRDRPTDPSKTFIRIADSGSIHRYIGRDSDLLTEDDTPADPQDPSAQLGGGANPARGGLRGPGSLRVVGSAWGIEGWDSWWDTDDSDG
jgi:hypothetical protein